MLKNIEFKYVDRPDVSETFVDHIGPTMFDGHSVRIELQSTRFDEPKPPSVPTGRRYPVSRLVLPSSAALELFNRLNQIVGVMVSQGTAKREDKRPTQIQ